MGLSEKIKVLDKLCARMSAAAEGYERFFHTVFWWLGKNNPLFPISAMYQLSPFWLSHCFPLESEGLTASRN